MDFFQAQEEAKRRTALLVGLFAAAVITIIVGVYLALVIGGGVAMGATFGFDPILFGVVAVGTLALIAGGSATRTAQLRKGGPAVAELMGAREVDPGTRDPNERRLVNVVEEMSVASGVPVPAIYVMDNEPSINAFAAGYTIHDAAVAVTQGALETLDRDELQGVMAHEFSHILNGDMRLNVRLIGLLFGILLLAVVGRGFLRGQMFRRRRGGSGGLFLGLALLVLGYMGVFFGKLIKAAVSRQREFLADAAAVQFTRNPRGIGGALRKIADSAHGSRVQDHHAEELSHLFFADGVGGALARSMATHPPLEERIRRIDASLAGGPGEGRRASAAVPGADAVSGAGAGAAHALGLAPLAGASSTAASPGGKAGRSGGGDARSIMGSVGSPSAEHMDYAGRLLDQIPDRVREAAHDRDDVVAVILALLGGGDEGSQRARREAAAALDAGTPSAEPGDGREAGPEAAGVRGTDARGRGSVQRALDEIEEMVEGLPAAARLPLADLCLPVLHGIAPARARSLRAAVDRVIQANGEVRPFDFALAHMLWRHLPVGGERGGRRGTSGRSPGQMRGELEVVLSALARAAGRSEEDAAAAFAAGAESLEDDAPGLSLRPADAVGLPELDSALDRLERGTLTLRRKALEAGARTILADREVRVEELELLRAVAESLELPLPPLRVSA